MNVAQEHPSTETALKTSGIACTILRNGWYIKNYTGSIPAALANGAFYGCAGESQISSAVRKDYAEAAVAVLIDAEHEGKIYELAGQAYTLAELAAEISRQTVRGIPYVDIPETDYAKMLATASVPEGFAKLIAGWNTSAKNGNLYSDSRDLECLIGRPTKPLAESVKTALA